MLFACFNQLRAPLIARLLGTYGERPEVFDVDAGDRPFEIRNTSLGFGEATGELGRTGEEYVDGTSDVDDFMPLHLFIAFAVLDPPDDSLGGFELFAPGGLPDNFNHQFDDTTGKLFDATDVEQQSFSFGFGGSGGTDLSEAEKVLHFASLLFGPLFSFFSLFLGCFVEFFGMHAGMLGDSSRGSVDESSGKLGGSHSCLADSLGMLGGSFGDLLGMLDGSLGGSFSSVFDAFEHLFHVWVFKELFSGFDGCFHMLSDVECFLELFKGSSSPC